MITTRHMHEYGTTLEQWAQVAVSTRKWAALNPKARNREPHHRRRTCSTRGRSCYPFNLLNICLVTDAGGAVVLTRADRAKDCAKKPVYVRGAGEATEHVMLTQMRDLTFSEATRMSARRPSRMAGVSPADFNHIMLYDAFTSGPPIMLEALGFAKRGEGVHFFQEGRSTPGGSPARSIPTAADSRTPDSGMSGSSRSSSPCASCAASAVRARCRTPSSGLVNGMGGMLSAAGTLVRRERALDRAAPADPREHRGAAPRPARPDGDATPSGENRCRRAPGRRRVRIAPALQLARGCRTV